MRRLLAAEQRKGGGNLLSLRRLRKTHYRHSGLYLLTPCESTE
jgi:hypothetical protein